MAIADSFRKVRKVYMGAHTNYAQNDHQGSLIHLNILTICSGKEQTLCSIKRFIITVCTSYLQYNNTDFVLDSSSLGCTISYTVHTLLQSACHATKMPPVGAYPLMFYYFGCATLVWVKRTLFNWQLPCQYILFKQGNKATNADHYPRAATRQ